MSKKSEKREKGGRMERKKPDKKLRVLVRVMDGPHFLPDLRGFVYEVLQLLEKLIIQIDKK